MRVTKRLLIAMACVILVSACSSCAGNNPPDVVALQVGGTVLDTATALQKQITAWTDAKTLSVPMAQKLTGYVQQVYDKSGPLGDAVKAYHDITDLNLKKLKAAEIEQLIADINSPLGKLLAEAVPEGVLRQFTLLVTNVMDAITKAQASVVAELKK